MFAKKSGWAPVPRTVGDLWPFLWLREKSSGLRSCFLSWLCVAVAHTCYGRRSPLSGAGLGDVRTARSEQLQPPVSRQEPMGLSLRTRVTSERCRPRAWHRPVWAGVATGTGAHLLPTLVGPSSSRVLRPHLMASLSFADGPFCDCCVCPLIERGQRSDLAGGLSERVAVYRGGAVTEARTSELSTGGVPGPTGLLCACVRLSCAHSSSGSVQRAPSSHLVQHVTAQPPQFRIAGDVVQSKGPEFNPQYYPKKTKEANKKMTSMHDSKSVKYPEKAHPEMMIFMK